jgi:hypothetical protein
MSNIIDFIYFIYLSPHQGHTHWALDSHDIIPDMGSLKVKGVPLMFSAPGFKINTPDIGSMGQLVMWTITLGKARPPTLY